MVDNLQTLAEYASNAGVLMVIEPMSRFRTHLINTPEQAMRLVEAADHPNLRITLDTYHMVTEVRDYGAAISATLPKLWGVHACESDRGVPGGGLVPWDRVCDALLKSDHTIRIMFETYNTAIDDFAFSRGLFQDVCPNPERFVEIGMTFLKRALAEAAERAGSLV